MLGGCGDFRSPICVNILQQTDIVITNPPFSLFREFVDLLVEYDKKFLILGNINAITCKNIFPLIRDNKIWLGQSIKGNNIKFEVPDNNSITDKQSHKIYANVNGVRWFTNLENNKPLKKLNLTKHYNKDEYPKYVNFDAINVDKVADIPYDYDGIMGVPISFIDKYNPEQFEIIGISADFAKSIYINGRIKENPGRFYLNINGEYKRLYDRILIKRRNNNK